MRVTKTGLAVAGLAAAGVILVGGPALADAATGSSTAAPSTGEGYGYGGQGGHGASNDTPVTGSEADKVSAAVKAKDSSVTVTSVAKDPDGSYDAFATKAGAQVRYDVSTDLKTITLGQGGPGGHGGGGGTPVTGSEADKVSAAVKAKDSSVTVTSVTKESDGSYDAFATKAGAQVRFEVSSDLKTITEGQAGDHGGHGGHGGPGGAEGSSSGATA